LPNFVVVDGLNEVILPLNGVDDKRILCLANLRPEKNHLLLLDIAVMLQQSHPDWTFHLVGQDFNDEYSFKLKKHIIEKSLEKQVFIYGTRPDVAPIINSCSIGVLTSISEGLPLAVLEYGLYNLPVVVSDVGGISTIVDHKVDGFMLPSGALQLFYESLVELIENKNIRLKFFQELKKNSEDSVLSTFSTWCNRL
jgi:glycosyltransferase involved in cell wall biosynthesis